MEVVQEILSEPPDILRFRILAQSGRALEEVKVSEFMSVSKRIADPGMEKDLTDELQTIFAELAFIPGFLGSLIGQLTEVEEEILGLVRARRHGSSPCPRTRCTRSISTRESCESGGLA
jgi:hypothetical protein